MASRGSGKWALVEHRHHSRASRVYRFQILLPNGTSTGLTLKDPGEEMPLHDFLNHIRTELENVPMDGGERRGIDWSGDVYLEDLLDRKIDKKVQFSDFATKNTNILRLQDGEGFVRTFENMWDLTPPTELLQELPAEYSTESALADLVDNSLQALWSNDKKDRKLIRITIDQEKIVIFDTGRGMDGSDENSISKWGTIGSSNHRVFRAKGIGGEAPYLVYDEDNGSMNTRRLVQFEVNGVDLAEILENEVTITNLHSCAGPDFILDVTFSCTSTTSANSQAHARVKCVYFPIVKTDLAQHDLFTKALRCLDGSSRSDSSVEDVNVDVHRVGRSLSCTQLEKQYHNWINNMHVKYDVEIDGGDNDHTVIINPSNKERLGISEDVEVIRVYTSVSRKGKTWKRGDHLKIQPGVVARMKSNFHSLKSIFYATLEYVVGEGLAGDICGEARLICRSIECSDNQGCLLEEGPDSMRLNIQESVSFPISMIDNDKVNSEGFVDLRGLLRVINGFGSQACLKIFRHKKEIFARTFQIAIRNLKAVKVPQSCQAGTLLENIIFEVSDSDGLIDESIHGPLHTLSIRSNELKLVEGAQYAFERGRCIVSHVPVPREPGRVTFVAYHTHFSDLETTIQIPVYTLDLVPVKGENESEPICSYPTSSGSSQNTIPPSQLVLSQSNSLAANIMGKFSDEIREIDAEICSQEVLIKAFDSRKRALENDIVDLQDEISHTAGSASGAKELTRHKIEENVGTAAAVLCSRQWFRDDVVGIVALLGTVADRKMSMMLSVYLGEDNMLAVVCKTLAAANYFEKYDADGSVDVHFGIHQEAANLGVPIRKRFPIICLDAIRLFGELQVYETRDDMWQAIPHLKNGAVSLDGGIIKGDGLLILGYSDPEVTFPVVPRAALDVEEDDSEYVCTRIKTMHAQMDVVKTLENRIKAAEEQRQKLVMERNEKKRKFDEISEVLSQPSGSGDHQLYQ
ncbi:hypothetical protein ACQ4PT_021531 [Festuca glaucescens]